jgi:molybdopterin-containing oxidoreductase family membrane subunit
MSSGLLLGSPSHAEIQARLLAPTWQRRGGLFRLGLAISASLTLLLLGCITYTVATGIGVWGNAIPVAWAFGIINFVWWIGIGHAGTFISAILYLLEQPWRNAISRFAEAMTLLAVLQAALFPVLHLGRPWFAYWLFPYPAVMAVWPNVRSALPWDAAAISTYGTVSLMFWYLGLIPDFASLRDHAPGRLRRALYGLFALGWRGDATTWRHYRAAYLLLAGMATPLVLSVHSIVSSDFAIGLTPGWHSTIFPPFFVAGAIYSGFAMVLTLVIPIRVGFGMQDFITPKHIDGCAKLMMTTGLLVSYGYAVEIFMAWYSGEPSEMYQFLHARPLGPNHTVFWLMMICNVGTPQLLWSRRLRRNLPLLFVASLAINLGMWCERFVIIVGGLQREYVPTMWRTYAPTWVDLSILAGTIGFFCLLFLLFLRFIPFVSVVEIKELKAIEEHEEAAA